MLENATRQVVTIRRNTLLLVTLFVAQLYVYINSSALFENFPQETAWVYMVIPLFLMVYSQRAQDEVKKVSLVTALKNAVLGFWLTFAVVLIIYIVLLGWETGSTARSSMVSTIVLTVLFVAPSEELMFRAMLPKYLEGVFKQYKWAAWILSQSAFASFHYAAYGGNTQAMVIAFVIGLIWLGAYKWKPRWSEEKLGLGFTIGSHACYNLIVSGILVGNVAMVVGGA